MKRKSGDRGEIYIISLDTFMLMAALGILFGIVFMVINPLVKFQRADVVHAVRTEISRVSYDKLINSIDFFNSK